MKTVLLRVVILLYIVCLSLLYHSRRGTGEAFAQPIQRIFKGRYSSELPFFSLNKFLLSTPAQIEDATRNSTQLQQGKIRFMPGKILSRPLNTLEVSKETPQISRAFNRRKLLPKEPRKKTHTGIIVELESAYGLYDTFIGRFQHGTQFKGAHYYMQGHWEKTDGEYEDRSEENIAARIKVDVDLSKSSTISLNGSYFQSSVDLPQLQDVPQHRKSAIQMMAGWQVNFEGDTDADIQISGEQARFSDQDDATFEMSHYGSQFLIKHLWSTKNTLSLDSTVYWDEYLQEDEHFETRYYETGALVNSFALRNNVAVDTGIQFDYYHSEDLHYTDYLIAPTFTTRFRLLRNTTLYTTYHPRLEFPDFTELYIRKIYTTVNPELHSEKVRHYLESGINQRFGELFSLNIGLFYRESEDILLQIDENNDNILEYAQPGSARFMGIKSNLQMNFAEQFVQNITYTYTTYDLLSWQQFSLTDEDPALDDILPYQPNHQVQASVYWVTPLGFAIDFNGIYISEQFRNRQANQNRIGKRFFLNVELIQKISDKFQVFLLGRNLTNTDTYDIIPILDSEEITSSRLFIGGARLRF